MNLLTARRQILTVAFFSVGFFAYGQFVNVTCPVPPIDPTEDSCRAYTEEHSKYVHDLYEKLQECETPESFSVAVVTKHGKQSTEAWPLCVGIKIQFEDACNDDSVHKCFMSARSIAQDKETKAAIDKTLSGAKSLEDAYHKAQSLQDSISNPHEFFKRALGDKMSDAEINALFLNKEDNYAVGNSAYRYALEFAKHGQEHIFKPDDFLARKVSSAALDKITSVMSSIFRQGDQTMEQIKTFHLDSPHSSSSTSIQTTLAPSPSSPSSDNNNVDCSVLQDPAKSRALQDQDEATYDALVKRCETNQSQ